MFRHQCISAVVVACYGRRRLANKAAGCLKPAEKKPFSYVEYTISFAVSFLTANEIVYSSYENAFSAGSRRPA